MKYKILYIDNTSGMFGGGQVSLLELLKRIDRVQFKPVIVLSESGKLKDEIEKIGLENEIIPMPAIRPFAILNVNQAIGKLNDFIRTNQISLVHANTSRAAFYAVKAVRKLKIPVVWHVRIPHRDILLDGFLARWSSAIIVVSQAVKDRFDWLKGNKVNVIYNGVDVQKFSPASPGGEIRRKFGLGDSDMVIGTAGRLSSEKGLECLILAAQSLVKAHSDIKFLIIGDGNEKYRRFLQDKIKGLKLESNFIFTGFCEDVSEIMRVLDIFCLPSLTEGFNRTLLEAMACGLPVVATSVGGNVEIVKNEVNGLLVPSGNVESLKVAIEELLKKKERAKKMGLEGQKTIRENFDIETNVKKTEEIYLQILK